MISADEAIFETGVFFIRDRANGVPLTQAVKNAQATDSTIVMNPTNPE
jgi:hypothetical protein